MATHSSRQLREYLPPHFPKEHTSVSSNMGEDVIRVDQTAENLHLICDSKGHSAVPLITPKEGQVKAVQLRKIFVGTKGIPHLVTHDADTINYPDLLITVNDTIQVDLETGKITV
ncbi:40S ribosomal protein S4 [Galemys pyrenaicus]|uniref:40S ribosomal protein S4 n=1 Tax=Galemys pyrenaicus TaxID=202257 RepID=A0A8J6DLD9_GALPY|nr:40S ribosomal protein S4 [Galemys pyrenaicus]